MATANFASYEKRANRGSAEEVAAAAEANVVSVVGLEEEADFLDFVLVDSDCEETLADAAFGLVYIPAEQGEGERQVAEMLNDREMMPMTKEGRSNNENMRREVAKSQ